MLGAINSKKINKINKRADHLYEKSNEIASEAELGHIKIGENLAIDEDGTLNVLTGGGVDLADVEEYINQLGAEGFYHKAAYREDINNITENGVFYVIPSEQIDSWGENKLPKNTDIVEERFQEIVDEVMQDKDSDDYEVAKAFYSTLDRLLVFNYIVDEKTLTMDGEVVNVKTIKQTLIANGLHERIIVIMSYENEREFDIIPNENRDSDWVSPIVAPNYEKVKPLGDFPNLEDLHTGWYSVDKSDYLNLANYGEPNLENLGDLIAGNGGFLYIVIGEHRFREKKIVNIRLYRSESKYAYIYFRGAWVEETPHDDGWNISIGTPLSKSNSFEQGGISLGRNVDLGRDSISIGSRNTTSEYSMALGHRASTIGSYSTAIGNGSFAYGDNEGVIGGSFKELGDEVIIPYSATAYWKVPTNLHVGGLHGFEIPHPVESKKETHVLRHSSVSSPNEGDNIYRYTLTFAEDGQTRLISLPSYFSSTNKNVQVFANAQGHFGNAYGVYNEANNRVNVTCELSGDYNILIIGTRKDINATSMWKEKGAEVLAR